MLPHDPSRIRHIIDACDEIENFISGNDLDSFSNDRKLHLSIVQLVLVIGEAASGVSDETKEQMPKIPWSDIIGMRNRLIHGYYDIDLEIVWKTATVEVPELRSLLEGYISILDER
jgi:uncharacterized protein with HEPN domain